MNLVLNNSDTAVFFDREGYLLPGWILHWDKKIAEHMAKQEGIYWFIPIHWMAVVFTRKYYIKNNRAPSVEEIADSIKVQVGELPYYFTYGAKTVMKIAGLSRTRCLLLGRKTPK